MKTITSRRMDALDANCEHLGLLRLQLMENAGAAVAAEIMNLTARERVLIVAGRGNNGGDGFVAARHLVGHQVQVLLLGRSGEIRTTEAAQNFAVLKWTNIPVVEVTDPSVLDPAYFSDRDVIVDAIFGTGIRGSIREPENTAIDLINGCGAKVVCVDVPSGIDPDGGTFEKAVRADVTVTFHLPKPGLLEENAQEYVGEIAVADIGIPKEAELLVGPGDVKLVTGRHPDSHKGDNGRVLIIGGGAFFGAPALAGLAALRSGADIATIAAPGSVAGTIASYSPDLIVRSLSEERLDPNDIPILRELARSHDVVVIGNGLGRDERTMAAVREILPACHRVVVDADALAALELPLDGCELVVTPHGGEFRMLSGEAIPDEREGRMAAVNRFSRENGVVTLLKGPEDIISNGQDIRINRTGNPGMSVGGTGDVLAGITGAFFASHSGIDAAAAAAYICGLAGDIAYDELGIGLLATDVIDRIPAALKGVRQ